MRCEFCGGSAELLARTQRQAWFGCLRCERTWQEDASVAARAPEIAAPGAPRSAAVLVPGARGVLVAIAAVALAFAVRFALKPFMVTASPFLLFTPAVMLASFYGGAVPGAIATGLSAIVGNHFFLALAGEPAVERWDRVALFLLVGSLITWFTTTTRNRRAELASSLWREKVARAQAEAADHAKDEFLALVSHELQTPASVILGWAAMLRTMPHSGGALERALDAIERNARLQSRLVGDILDTSRILSGTLRMERRRVDVSAIVAAAVEQIRGAADARHVRIEVEGEDRHVTIVGDPVRLQQVFTNLLANAVKFTPEGGRVRASIETTEREVRVAVADTGVGIAPDFLPHVFQRFRQDPRTIAHSRAGLGLGLSIARHFVERHNGTISVASEGLGRGSTFTVVLPIAPAPDAAARGRAVPLGPGALADLEVLVVEDDDDTRLMITGALEQYGARVRGVRSAAEARDAAIRVPPDVLVSDLRLPDEDGIALLESLRAGAMPPARMRAASMTASRRAEDRERALAAGYDVHLQKPIAPDELALVVRTLCGAPAAAPTGTVH